MSINMALFTGTMEVPFAENYDQILCINILFNAAW